MTVTLGFVVAGALLITMALSGSVLRRLPLTTSMLYLAVGFALGSHGAGLFDVDPIEQSATIERIT